MDLTRPLRGGCRCRRNLYIIRFPKEQEDINQLAKVLFSSDPHHRATLGTPLPTYLRVPLQHYQSLTFPQYSNETNSQIHRVYREPGIDYAMHHFCGFCGTPLSYWSESPRTEADFIHLTLGSLLPEDLGDLEEWGLLGRLGSSGPSSGASSGASSRGISPEKGGEERGEERGKGKENEDGNNSQLGPRGTDRVGVLPWFDRLTEGSRLGRTLRRTTGVGSDQTGNVRVEWEIVEWTEEDEDGGGPQPQSSYGSKKRKVDQVEDVEEGGRMKGPQ
ncbi:uncharacterized protein C8A04DRAFT_35053 [Dichotomopilus funicola]|uniref:CENP-V/GFA domain-containing protein n=1 Tax=Dichotomopilus funicola TaxID=1934379 RepID=A0AAN6V972_9PEZI|nr:hypothetical protein C8A04DRAFT_35053 [Dichotomopilus funicola]